MSKRLRLTEELRYKIKNAGFNYFLIVHVDLNQENKTLKSIIVQPVKNIPTLQKHSCTSIDDAMIADIIGNSRSTVSVFVDFSLS